MANIRLIVEYDGSAFHGWQLQDGLDTVQGVLTRSLETFLRIPVHPLHASGRTDAGVHAKGQVVSFKVPDDQNIDLKRLSWAISSMNCGTLAVLNASFVPETFHPRACAKRKQYTYTILNRYAPAIFERGRVWEIRRELDVNIMNMRARELVGQHDFTSFRDTSCTAKTSARTIYESEVLRDGDYIRYRVVGSGFLRYMVRIIVGTLVEYGDLSRVGDLAELIIAKDRSKAGITAPALGLCLDWVSYS